MLYRWLIAATSIVVATAVCLTLQRSQLAPVYRKVISAVCLLLAAGFTTVALLPPPTDLTQLASPAGLDRPPAKQMDGYVGAATCRECHPNEHRSWHDSYHRTMTQVVTPETVLTDLSNVSLTDRGQHVNIRRKGDEYFAELEEPVLSQAEGRPVRVERKLVLSTGSHHMQMYWYPLLPKAPVLSLLPFAYLKAEDRWVPRDYVFLSPHQPTPNAEIGRWNMTCIQCHATHGKSGILEQSAGGQSTFNAYEAKTNVAEFGISCEECHGPGERHVAWAQAKSDPASDPEIVHPGRIAAERSAEICGQCHGIWEFLHLDQRRHVQMHGETFRPGEVLAKHKRLLRSSSDYETPEMKEMGERNMFLERNWSDGMVRVSGREYNAISDSPCYHGGELSCLTCHEMHPDANDPRPTEQWADDMLREGMRTNAACTQCHPRFEDEQALVKHTHHAPNSSGSNCYNCHASYTTYGLLKAIRSHQIDSPSVQTSLTTGRPNACNQCHLDQTLQWTADQLHAWYGIERPQLGDEDRRVAASVQWLLKGDAGQRALMAWTYGWPAAQEASGSQWMAPYLGQLMADPYDAVRFIAQRSLRQFDEYKDFPYDFTDQRHRDAPQRVLEQWSAAGDWSDVAPERAGRVLIDQRGLQRDRFQRLLEQRDDSEISLAE